MRALMLAAKSTLQSLNTWDDTICDVGVGPEPAPVCDDLFVRIHPGEWNCLTHDEGGDLDESYGVAVTISRRLPYAPADREGTEVLLKQTEGLMEVAALVRTQLHFSYAVINTANTTLGGSVNGFVEPLRFRNAQTPAVRSADWFSSEQAEHCGLSTTLFFGGARRVQTLESMT